MWQEYTREIPARPGLTLVATALALGGSVALAYVLTGQRAGPEPGERRHPAGWPISIELPRGLIETADRFFLNRDFSGAIDHVFFQDPTTDSLLLRYEIKKPGTTSEDVLGEMSDRIQAARPVHMGITEGRYVVGETPFGLVYLAGVCTSEGLAVRMIFLSTATDAKSGRAFKAICSSIRWECWSVSRDVDDSFREDMQTEPGQQGNRK